jgi:hypothetical protein
MKVIVSLEVENCKDCPHYDYGGTNWGEDMNVCKKTGKEIEPDGVSHNCPFIPSMEKLMESYHKLEEIKSKSKNRNGYEPGIDPLWPL